MSPVVGSSLAKSTTLKSSSRPGMRNVFRGIIIKTWTGHNFETSEDPKHKKNHCLRVRFFWTGCWVDRLNTMCDEEEQSKRLTQQCGKYLMR